MVAVVLVAQYDSARRQCCCKRQRVELRTDVRPKRSGSCSDRMTEAHHHQQLSFGFAFSARLASRQKPCRFNGQHLLVCVFRQLPHVIVGLRIYLGNWGQSRIISSRTSAASFPVAYAKSACSRRPASFNSYQFYKTSSSNCMAVIIMFERCRPTEPPAPESNPQFALAAIAAPSSYLCIDLCIQ